VPEKSLFIHINKAVRRVILIPILSLGGEQNESSETRMTHFILLLSKTGLAGRPLSITSFKATTDQIWTLTPYQ